MFQSKLSSAQFSTADDDIKKAADDDDDVDDDSDMGWFVALRYRMKYISWNL